MLKSNLQRGRLTLVLGTDRGGHWVAVVRNDDRGTVRAADDDVILADPYDRVDGDPDGRTVFDAERFDSLGSDALTFGRMMRRV